MKMFEYQVNEKEVNKIMEGITFTEVYKTSLELDAALDNGLSFEQFIYNRFGEDYFKRANVVAIAKSLINLY